MSTPNLPKPSPKFLPSRQTLRKHKTSIRRALSRDKLLLWMVVVPMLFSMVYFVILAKDRYVSESLAVVKRADDSSALVGSNKPYAAMMHFGGDKSDFPHLWGDIPGRPFLPMDTEGQLQPEAEESILELAMHHLQKAARL